MWKGPEYCRAPLGHAEAGAGAESPTQRLGWALLDALLQHLVHVPRGPNPAQLGLQDASLSGWPGCAVAAPRSTGWGNTRGWLQCVDKCSWVLLALMPRGSWGSLLCWDGSD